jgi:hypothetical protein
MRNSESSKTKQESLVQMLRARRRIERLEHALDVTDRIVHVIRINYIDSDGRVTGTVVMSDVPELCVPYQDVAEESPKEAA